MECNRILTFSNWIVLMCGSWGHSYHKDATSLDRSFEQIKQLHFHKIVESEAIVVVSDSSGYIGDSTKEELSFALFLGMPVFYYDGSKLTGSTSVDSVPDRFARHSHAITDWREVYVPTN